MSMWTSVCLYWSTWPTFNLWEMHKAALRANDGELCGLGCEQLQVFVPVAVWPDGKFWFLPFCWAKKIAGTLSEEEVEIVMQHSEREGRLHVHLDLKWTNVIPLLLFPGVASPIGILSNVHVRLLWLQSSSLSMSFSCCDPRSNLYCQTLGCELHADNGEWIVFNQLNCKKVLVLDPGTQNNPLNTS